MHKNIQLLISSIVVIVAAFLYGINPSSLIPSLLGFNVEHLELTNIFRAIMGLYLAFAGYWVFGVLRPKHWHTASLSNVLFMGGLGFGRLISLIIDGISTIYSIGMLLELLMMFWGIYNLKQFSTKYRKAS